jgi:hypothetical protein
MAPVRPASSDLGVPVTADTEAAIRMVQALSFGHVASGDPKIGLLLLLALEPFGLRHPRHLRLLAYAYLAAGEPERALATLDRLGESAGRSLGLLLKSRALLAAGRHLEARAVFATFVAEPTEQAA